MKGRWSLLRVADDGLRRRERHLLARCSVRRVACGVRRVACSVQRGSEQLVDGR